MQSGKELIKRLASVWGVPVSASDWYQSKGRKDFIGTVFTATPSGTVTANVSKTAEGVRNFLSKAFIEGIEFIMYNLIKDHPSL